MCVYACVCVNKCARTCACVWVCAQPCVCLHRTRVCACACARLKHKRPPEPQTPRASGRRCRADPNWRGGADCKPLPCRCTQRKRLQGRVHWGMGGSRRGEPPGGSNGLWATKGERLRGAPGLGGLLHLGQMGCGIHPVRRQMRCRRGVHTEGITDSAACFGCRRHLPCRCRFGAQCTPYSPACLSRRRPLLCHCRLVLLGCCQLGLLRAHHAGTQWLQAPRPQCCRHSDHSGCLHCRPPITAAVGFPQVRCEER